jgi:hypothetical protein
MNKCDFSAIKKYFNEQETNAKKKEDDEKYGYCIIDGYNEKVSNFR